MVKGIGALGSRPRFGMIVHGFFPNLERLPRGKSADVCAHFCRLMRVSSPVDRDLNAQLRGALDESALLVQKGLLMKEVDHRVQNSLQLVNAMLMLQAEEAADEQVKAQFDQARQRIMAIAMVHRRLWHSDHIQSVDFRRYIEELRDGLVETWGREWQHHVKVHGLHVLIPTDTAVPVPKSQPNRHEALQCRIGNRRSEYGRSARDADAPCRLP